MRAGCVSAARMSRPRAMCATRMRVAPRTAHHGAEAPRL
ncbi:hypothetical protein BURMUCGD2M_3988 [Burkholderia multivorans CGD2M]|nr:hypothetical protein BURMUCGD2M_3988 [Burkholderia multivorans CGD2M]